VTLRFAFRLRDPEAIPPWGHELHWFGLTDGAWCLETPTARLLEHEGPPDPGLGVAWCDYALARPLEDLLDSWPAIAEPIAPALAAHLQSWHPAPAPLPSIWSSWLRAHEAALADEALPLETWSLAQSWADARRIDLGYLSPAPRLALWRLADATHLAWSATLPWHPARLDLVLPFATLQSAAETFLRDILAAMSHRVATIARNGWPRPDVTLDIPALAAEQHAREAGGRLPTPARTDWNAVLAAIRRVEAHAAQGGRACRA
jgi:hypothetical protein